MTPQEFISNAAAWNNSAINWQSNIAHALDVSPQAIKKIANGGKVNSKIATAMLDLCGETAPQAVHAEWINGEGEDGREYLIHTRHPRFQALVITGETDYDIENDNGVIYQCGYSLICGFLWIDRRPDNLTELMESACDALEEIAVICAPPKSAYD